MAGTLQPGRDRREGALVAFEALDDRLTLGQAEVGAALDAAAIGEPPG
jgi:hypothetical protein